MTGRSSVGIPVPEMDAETPPTAAFKVCGPFYTRWLYFASISDIAKSGIFTKNQPSIQCPTLVFFLSFEFHCSSWDGTPYR